MSCSNIIQSNDIYDFIVSSDERNIPLIAPVCIQSISREYSVLYYDRSTVPPLSISDYSYTSIPKLFSLMDSTSLDVSGITAVQNQPTFSLKGDGVLIGIVDTGIDYANPLFVDADGNSKILSIWDQTVMESVDQTTAERGNQIGTKEQVTSGFFPQYGATYSRVQINEALKSEKVFYKNP